MATENRKQLITKLIFSKVIDLGCNAIICNVICHLEKVKLKKIFSEDELVDIIVRASECVEVNCHVNDHWNNLPATEKYEVILKDVTRYVVDANEMSDSLSYSE